MRKTSIVCAVFLLCSVPLSVSSWNEKTDWKLAKQRDSFRAYYDYLEEHPRGPHAKQARRTAAKRAADEMRSSARRCGKLFPQMAYFAMVRAKPPAASLSILDFSLSRAAACEYSFHLDIDEMRKALQGLIKVREEVKDTDRFPTRAMLDLDSILLDLEQAIVNELDSKIFMCGNQSAWTDTSPEEFRECASAHLSEKKKIVPQAAKQISFDLNHISGMEKDYRKDFWKRYYRISDNKAFAEFVVRAHAVHLLERAKSGEDSALISMRIERVINRVDKYRSKLKPMPGKAGKGDKNGG